jgi:putative flippase GtrA
VPVIRPSHWQLVGFITVGGFSAVLSLFVRYVANPLMPFEAAVIVAHIAGMMFSFAVNRAIIFPATNRPASVELSKFATVNVASLIIASSVSSFLYRVALPLLNVTVHPNLIAHFLGLATCAVPSFLGHKYFSFSSSGNPAPG